MVVVFPSCCEGGRILGRFLFHKMSSDLGVPPLEEELFNHSPISFTSPQL